MTKFRKLKAIAYSDATCASMEDGSSHGRNIIFIKGSSNKLVSISWQSKKLVRVTKSLFAFVVLPLEESTNSGFLMPSFIQEIFNMSALPVVCCYSNNRSLADTLKTTSVISNRRLD